MHWEGRVEEGGRQEGGGGKAEGPEKDEIIGPGEGGVGEGGAVAGAGQLAGRRLHGDGTCFLRSLVLRHNSERQVAAGAINSAYCGVHEADAATLHCPVESRVIYISPLFVPHRYAPTSSWLT